MMARVRWSAERLTQAASSALVVFAVNAVLPQSSTATVALLLVGSAATYLFRRDGRILRWSPAESAIRQHISGEGWQQENRRLAACCAAMLIAGGVFSLVVRTWIERMALTVPAMMSLGDTYALGQWRQAVGSLAGALLRSNWVLLLVFPGFLPFRIARSWRREAVVQALPSEPKALHLRFEACLCNLCFSVAVIVASVRWWVIAYDVLMLGLWWTSRRPRRWAMTAQEAVLEEGLRATRSRDGAILLSLATSLALIPAFLSLTAERYDAMRCAVAGCYLLLPAVPLALAVYARRPRQGALCLPLALAGTAVLGGLGLYVGVRFPEHNPAGSLLLDVASASLAGSASATRAAVLTVTSALGSLARTAAVAASGILYPMAVLAALAEGWLYRGRLSRWYGYVLLSYSLFLGSMAVLCQFAVAHLVSGGLVRAPDLSRMAIVRLAPAFHIVSALVFLGVAVMGWLLLRASARVLFLRLSSLGGWSREPAAERRWQRVATCIALGGIVVSGGYAVVLLNGTNTRVIAMRDQVARAEEGLRRAIAARDWEDVAQIAEASPIGEARMDALMALGSNRRVDQLAVITAALHDPNPDVSASALTTCAYLGDPRALPQVRAYRSSARPVYRPFVDLAVRRLAEMSELGARRRQGRLSARTYAGMAAQSLERWSEGDAELRRALGEPAE